MTAVKIKDIPGALVQKTPKILMRKLRAKRKLASLLERHIKMVTKILEEIKKLNEHPRGCRCKECERI